MSEYISREALKDYLEKNISFGGIEKKFRFYDIIDSLPSAFEGMTNGEVIKAIFGIKDEQVVEAKYLISIYPKGNHCDPFIAVKREVWNSPYQKGGE